MSLLVIVPEPVVGAVPATPFTSGGICRSRKPTFFESLPASLLHGFSLTFNQRGKPASSQEYGGPGGSPELQRDGAPPNTGSGTITENSRVASIANRFHDFLNGGGSVGNPEALKIIRFPCIFHEFLNGEGSVGNPESLKMHRFPCLFLMISLMEKEAWETQDH